MSIDRFTISSNCSRPLIAFSGRVVWLDVAKALGIMLVVFGHVERGLISAGALDPEIWSRIDFAIYTFHMPLFFFLSGMNVLPSRSRPGFFRRRAKAIILPYVMFSLLQGCMQIMFSGSTNGNLSWLDLAKIPFAPISPFWFLYVLMIYVSIVALWRPGLAMLAVSVVMMLISPLIDPLDTGGFPLFQAFYFFPFYVLGIVIQIPRLRIWVGISAWAIWASACFLAISSGMDLRQYYALSMLPAAIGGSLGLIWIAQRIGSVSNVLAYCGRNVIAIYVMHIMAAAGIRVLLMRLGLSDPLTLLLLGSLGGFCLPLVALWVLQRLRLAKLVGLPPGTMLKSPQGIE
ncbi:MAG: hypothetical protein EP336_18055 [Rhodobacteraceae bacterium]|nr:MAG: hypothetical protein EP336_18055 [Paracoccaceae bacterium]